MTAAIGVALPADGQLAQILVNRASALAQRLNGRWVAFVICNDAIPSQRGNNALRQAEMAMLQGGTVFFCEGEDIAQTLLALAAREQVDVLILGSPHRAGLARWFRRSIVDSVVRAPRSFDVMVIGNGHQP